MGIVTIILLGVLVLVVVWAVMIYNNLVQVKHNVSKAWANIDVLLKQRHDELPKLVETCKQYMKFEQDTLTKVMEARSKVFTAREQQNIGALGPAEGMLRGALGNLFALAEAYPDLKTNQTFQQLQTRISSLENAIADRREFYNDVVTLYNTRLEQIPDSWVGQGMQLESADLFRITEREREDPRIEFRMSA